MPTFTLKALFVAITAATVGFALIFYTLELRPTDRLTAFAPYFTFFALWFTAGAIVGGAFASLLKQTLMGAILGVIVQFMMLFAL